MPARRLLSRAPAPATAGVAAARRRGLHFLLALVLLGLFPWGAPPASGADEVSKEYLLKAAFLYNFTKFVVWPPRSSSEDRSLVIGVLGANPFGGELERLVSGRNVGGRGIEIRFIKSVDEARAAHMVFVPDGEERKVSGAMDKLHAAGVLTVGESSLFAGLGGIVTFKMEGDKIRFEIQREAALRAGLKISPQLLKLATSNRKGSE